MNTVIVAAVALITNILLGLWRTKYRKMSFMWLLLIHASIPLIVPLRIWLDTPRYFIPLFIAIAAAGQFIGPKLIKPAKS